MATTHDTTARRGRSRRWRRALGGVVLLATTARAQPGPAGPVADASVRARLGDFDAYVAKVLRDWDVPGLGVGIVVRDRLVFAKGYGYRDYGRKLPYTPTTAQPIAS